MAHQCLTLLTLPTRPNNERYRYSKYVLQRPSLFDGLVRAPNVLETQKLQRAVLNGTQYRFERWAGHLFSNSICICLGGYNVHVDGEVGNPSHEISHSQDPAVDAGRAFDFEHGDDCVSVEPDHIDILDDLGDGVAEARQYELVDTALTQRVTVICSVCIIDCDADIVTVLVAQLCEEPLNFCVDATVVCAITGFCVSVIRS